MYFDVAPKTRREDLFGMSYLADSLVSRLSDENVRAIVVKGLRRTGKTSLLNVVLNETKQKHVKIDVREAPYYDRKEFMLFVAEKVKAVVGEPVFQKVLRRVSGVKFSYGDAGAALYFETEKTFLSFFEKLDEQLKARHLILVIAFDEVQLLTKIKFDEVLAAVYDDYENIKLVLTGSEMGLIDGFLGKKNADSPLFGRAFIEVETKKFDSEQTSKFLTEGFEQINKKIALSELTETIELLDGVIGWTTYYGWLRSKNVSHENALSRVSAYGSKLAKSELDNFLANRRKATYLKVLKWIAKGHNQWSLLKKQFAESGVKTSDRQLDLYLTELIDYGFVEKADKVYFIADPLLLKAVK